MQVAGQITPEADIEEACSTIGTGPNQPEQLLIECYVSEPQASSSGTTFVAGAQLAGPFYLDHLTLISLSHDNHMIQLPPPTHIYLYMCTHRRRTFRTI